MKVAVSILSSSYSDSESIERINQTDADYLHVDVGDGHFVNKIREYEGLYLSKKPLDVHLMVSSPFNYISKYSVMNTEAITLSLEIDEDLNSLLDYIHARGLKCGLAIKPETSIERLEPYLEKLDRVLVMTVNPGAGGQKFLESTIYKIDILKKLRKERGLSFEIFADGGINAESIGKLKNVDGVISGSFIAKSDNYQDRINQLRL